VVVTETLDWRLHAFDLMSEWSAERPPEALMSHGFLLADQYKPEEVRKGAWDMLRDAPPWCGTPAAAHCTGGAALQGAARLTHSARCRAVDAWGMGCFVQEVFGGRKLARTEDLRELSRVPPVRAPRSGRPKHRAANKLLSDQARGAPLLRQALQKHYQRLLGSVPTRRLNPASLLESSFFSNKLVR
jgi:SCY1-like protein 1